MKFKLILGVLILGLVIVAVNFKDLNAYVSGALLIVILMLIVFVFYLNGQYKRNMDGGLPDTRYTYAQK